MSTLVLARATDVASPLLRLIAPAYADVLAALWPAPHAPFVTAPTARRHLICLALSGKARDGGETALDLTALLEAPLRKAARRVVDPAPEGLARALERLGEVAWAPEDYRALLALLAEPKPAKTLRHAAAITPEQVRTLSALPRALREAGGAAVRVTAAQAALLAEAHALLARRLPPALLAEREAAWTRATGAKALFALVAEDFRRDPPAAPYAGTERLRPLDNPTALRDAARRYRNCLAGYIDSAVDRRCAIYEWLPAPGAVIELIPDPYFGWRLDQARLENNRSVDEAMRKAIIQELRDMGVHVGRSCWQIRHALDRAASPTFELEPVDATIADYFRDD